MALVISTQGFYERNVKTEPLLAKERVNLHGRKITGDVIVTHELYCIWHFSSPSIEYEPCADGHLQSTPWQCGTGFPMS